MGQYYKGRKIGTCEIMYYMRLTEAKKLADMGASDDDGIKFNEYLTDNITMFRFPFPDEDQRELADVGYESHEKRFIVPAIGIDAGHDTITVHSTRKDGGDGINIFIPCPYSEEFKDANIKTSTGGPGGQKLDVLFEGMRNGEVKTIFACSRCGAMQRFSGDDIEKIKEQARNYYAWCDTTDKNPEYKGNQELYDRAMTIINRIN